MKRTIVIEVLLSFIFVVLAYLFISYLINAVQNFSFADNWLKSNLESGYDGESVLNEAEIIKEAATRQILFATLLYLPAVLADLAAMIIIAIHPLPGFKPLVEKYSKWSSSRKEAREAERAEKAEADKQRRIEELQAELDALKKDE